MRDRRAERRQATVREIVESAWRLARAEGLAGLSLRDLAREVGMQAQSLYSYFDSKHAIYDAMYAHGYREYAEREAALVLTGSALPDLKTLVSFFVEFCTEDPVRYQLLFQRTIPGFEPSAESFAISSQSLDALRAHLADIGITDPADVDLLTAIGTGLTDQQISNDPGGDRWARLIDDAMDMFFHHVSNRSTPPKQPKKNRSVKR